VLEAAPSTTTRPQLPRAVAVGRGNGDNNSTDNSSLMTGLADNGSGDNGASAASGQTGTAAVQLGSA